MFVYVGTCSLKADLIRAVCLPMKRIVGLCADGGAVEGHSSSTPSETASHLSS